MLNSHIVAYVSRCFEESRRRHIEPGYLLLSTGRVFEVEREEWFSSYESYADRLGAVLAHMESGKAADDFAEAVNAAGGAAIRTYYSAYLGELSPSPFVGGAAGAPGVIYVSAEKLMAERLPRLCAFRLLADELQAWNTWNTGGYYGGALYSSSEAYLRKEASESFGAFEPYAGDSLADYASEWLDLTAVELEEIRARFDD